MAQENIALASSVIQSTVIEVSITALQQWQVSIRCILLLASMGLAFRFWPAGAFPPKAYSASKSITDPDKIENQPKFLIKPQLISLFDILFGNGGRAEAAMTVEVFEIIDDLEFEIVEDDVGAPNLNTIHDDIIDASQLPAQDDVSAPAPLHATPPYTMKRYSFKRPLTITLPTTPTTSTRATPTHGPPPPTPMPSLPNMSMQAQQFRSDHDDDPCGSYEEMERLEDEDYEESIQDDKNKIARKELVDAAVALTKVVMANQPSISLLGKARTYLHLATDQMSEVSDCCDSHIVLTRLLNALRTEIVEYCINSNCIANTPTNEPVHEPEDQSDLFADFETSEPLDLEVEFEDFHTRGMKLCVHPNEASLSCLSLSGKGNSVPPNSAVLGAMTPGSSPVLASATCNQ